MWVSSHTLYARVPSHPEPEACVEPRKERSSTCWRTRVAAGFIPKARKLDPKAWN